jgi:hypothetical protein
MTVGSSGTGGVGLGSTVGSKVIVGVLVRVLVGEGVPVGSGTMTVGSFGTGGMGLGSTVGSKVIVGVLAGGMVGEGVAMPLAAGVFVILNGVASTSCVFNSIGTEVATEVGPNEGIGVGTKMSCSLSSVSMLGGVSSTHRAAAIEPTIRFSPRNSPTCATNRSFS